MFRIKICGITNVEDALVAADAGADAIGLNFYEKSPRFVTGLQARQIADYSYKVIPVGVFVNSSAEEVGRILTELELWKVQIHGDEPPTFLAALPQFIKVSSRWAGRETFSNVPCQIVRARRFDDRGVAAIAQDLTDCMQAGRRAQAVLVDAATPGRYGGTGETVSWVGLADHRRWLGDTPLILAGGLNPDNVAEAIRIVRPHGVDVASGVESAPGKKDPHKVRDFVAAALRAFEG